jgi:guanine nucleotide-binding protein subunit alpha
MGCGMSTEDKEGKARNEEIENQLKRDKMMQRNEIKMLLLGEFVNYVAIRPVVLIDHSKVPVNLESPPS